MRLIITFLMAWCLSLGAYAATAPDSKQITQELEQAIAAKPAQPELVDELQSALNTTPAHWLTTKKTRSNPSKETLTCA